LVSSQDPMLRRSVIQLPFTTGHCFHRKISNHEQHEWTNFTNSRPLFLRDIRVSKLPKGCYSIVAAIRAEVNCAFQSSQR
jgi:hypothetical protein